MLIHTQNRSRVIVTSFKWKKSLWGNFPTFSSRSCSWCRIEIALKLLLYYKLKKSRKICECINIKCGLLNEKQWQLYKSTVNTNLEKCASQIRKTQSWRSPEIPPLISESLFQLCAFHVSSSKLLPLSRTKSFGRRLYFLHHCTINRPRVSRVCTTATWPGTWRYPGNKDPQFLNMQFI